MSALLSGFRVLEVAGRGPLSFAAMLLADHGANVIRLDRVSAANSKDSHYNVMLRGRRSIAVDLKRGKGVDVALRLAEESDVLLEGFRPGVAERLGIGPDACLARNPKLIYGRLTGWGQTGPLARAAGHDINYIAVAGALYPIGPAENPPPPPLNYVGDYGGGGMLLAFGVVAALLHARRSGRGAVIDAAMVDGAALQTAVFQGMISEGRWSEQRGSNFLDGAAPFYRCYRCKDGKFLAVGAIERSFQLELLARLGLEPADWIMDDPVTWPAFRRQLQSIFLTRTRDEWAAIFEGSDACVAPVLSLAEAPNHPHNAARGMFSRQSGVNLPSIAPRVDGKTATLPSNAPRPGQHTQQLLVELGYCASEIAELYELGAVVQGEG